MPGKDPLLSGFELGDWYVDVSGNQVCRGSESRPLRHKAMELLVLLARHAGQTVSRETIVDAVWQGNRFVAPKAINTAAWAIRQALGDDPDAPRYLLTVAKKGYRLIAPVRPREVPGAGAVAAPAPPPGRGGTPSRRGVALAGAAAAVAALTAIGAIGLEGRTPWSPQPAALQATPAPGLHYTQVTALTQEPGIEYLGALSPDGRQLAFAWWRGRGEGGLYLRTVGDNASEPRPLGVGAGDVHGLSWSPDGQALAFIATRADGGCTLWLQPLSGERRALAACAPLFTPGTAWSPDGRWIAFAGEGEGAGGLFLVAPDGSGLRRLTTSAPAAMADHQPAWSADGLRLAFVRQDPADGTRDLHEVTLDGQVRRLSTLRLHHLHGLTYAADGQDLVFSTTRQDRRVLLRWRRGDGMALPLGLDGSAPVMASDGRLVFSLMRTHVGIARLSFGAAPERLFQTVGSDRSPRVSPDGRRAALVSGRSGAQELWLVQSDGSRPVALTTLDGLAAEPAWSPAGDQLAFLGNCGPGRRHGLCLLQLGDGRVRPLAADAASYGRPAWHPTRPEVWVASDRGGRWQLWRFALDGSSPATVDTDEPPGRALQWVADGGSLVYQPWRAQYLRERPFPTPAGGPERRLDVTATGETLVDWQTAGQSIVTLTRSDRERWRRLDLISGRRDALGEHALGSFPERASFTVEGPRTVLVEVANTDLADIMVAR